MNGTPTPPVPAVAPVSPFDDYVPAHRYSATVVRQFPDRPFSEVEDDIRRHYESTREASTFPYDRAGDSCCVVLVEPPSRRTDSP